LNRNYYKLANAHILLQTLVLHHRNTTAAASAAAASATTTAATTVTTIILSDTTFGITIIEMKTKAALNAANEHLSATTTLVVINAIHFCVAT